MDNEQNQTPANNNRGLIIGAIIVVVLLIIVVVVLIISVRGSDQPELIEATATEVAMEMSATVTPEEPTATITDEPTEEPTEEPTAEPTEEPTEEPTAEPTQEPPAVLPPEPQAVTFQAEDGQSLEGRYYPAATLDAPLIILMHWAPGSQEDWNEIAFWLQNRGLSGSSSNVGGQTWLDPSWFPPVAEGKSYAVFTFNFRQGSSRELLLLDAQAAFETAGQLEGVDPNRVAAFGASIGADGAADGCAWNNQNLGPGCLAALSISPGSYLTVPYSEVVEKLGAESPPKPAWCFYASQDSPAVEACTSASGDHYHAVEWQDGDWHGMQLIDPARDPNPLSLILEWLALSGL